MIEVIACPWGFSVMAWSNVHCDAGAFVSDHKHANDAANAAVVYAQRTGLSFDPLCNVVAFRAGGEA